MVLHGSGSDDDAEIKRKHKQLKKEAMRKKVEEDELNKAIAPLKKDFQKRKALQEQVYGKGGPEAQVGGSLGKAIHQAGLTAEGVAFEMLFVMLFNFLAFLTNVKYREQQRDYEDAKKLGPPDVAYETGKGIDIYPLDSNGQPDFSQAPYPDGEASRAEIRANGYVTPPSQQEAFLSQWDEYTADMMGPGLLSPTQRERLYKGAKEVEGEMKHKDLMSDQAYRNALKPPVKRP